MLFDQAGTRKYLTADERRAFIRAAKRFVPLVETFCLTLVHTGARISEVLALTPDRIDRASHAIIIESLKKRSSGIFRAVPVPDYLIDRVIAVHGIASRTEDEVQHDERLWPWSRTTAWQHVKTVMIAAGIPRRVSKPKALRHGFGVAATQSGVTLNIIQRWMGHARLETTAIYANAVGDEERALARRMWKGLP
jgi:integrase